ncbi:MAG TPA: hypothetical protein VF758_07035, partial [Candidatus Acidoferrum sp.]
MEHVLRTPVESRQAYEQRRKRIAFGILLALAVSAFLAALIAGCGGNGSTAPPVTPSSAVAPLSAAEVDTIVKVAAQASDLDTMVIAVVDRGGKVLAVYRKASAGAT